MANEVVGISFFYEVKRPGNGGGNFFHKLILFREI